MVSICITFNDFKALSLTIDSNAFILEKSDSSC